MTDNEKAATFIGWRPCNGEPCTEQSHRIPIPDGKVFKGCTIIDHSAPDMSKPENYMRALEAIHDRKPYFRWEGGRFGISDDWEDGWIWGESIVETLAALYDAEHPEAK